MARSDDREDVFVDNFIVSVTLETYQSWQRLVMAEFTASRTKTPPLTTHHLVFATALAGLLFFDVACSSISAPTDISVLSTIFIPQSLILRSPLAKPLVMVLLLPRGSSASPLLSGNRPRNRININFHQTPADPFLPPLPPHLFKYHLQSPDLPLTRLAVAHMSKLEAEKTKKTKKKGSDKSGERSSQESSEESESDSFHGSQNESESSKESESETETEEWMDDEDSDIESDSKSESEDGSESQQENESGQSETDYELELDSEDYSWSSLDSDSESETSKWPSLSSEAGNIADASASVEDESGVVVGEILNDSSQTLAPVLKKKGGDFLDL